MRDLAEIIDKIVKVAPDLGPLFVSLRESTMYTPPGMLPERWRQAADILNGHAGEHPKKDEIRKIFNDEKDAAQEE